MDNKTRQELTKELDQVNKEFDELEQLLIDSINTVGLEALDLYTFINLKDKLTIKKDKIQYKIVASY